jgi:hypothetical protein
MVNDFIKLLKSTSLISLAFMGILVVSGCDYFSDPNCADITHIYRISHDGGYCFAELIPFEGCMEISAESANNAISQFCKDTDDGLLFFQLGSAYSIKEPGWGRCPTYYQITDEPSICDDGYCNCMVQ